MSREARRDAAAGATAMAIDWIDRALVISLLRQTTGTGIAHQKSLNRVLSTLKGRHDWSYLDARDANPFAVPDGRAEREILEVSEEVVDFLLRELFEKVPLRGVVAETLFGLLEDLEAAKAGRYELPESAPSLEAAGSA